MVKAVACVALLFMTAASVHGQAPLGTIAGIVTDASGAVLQGAHVAVVHRDTNQRRSLATSSAGAFTAVALPPGVYDVTVELPGFTRVTQPARVETGTITICDVVLSVRGPQEIVNVEVMTPLVRRDEYQVTGVVTREQIERLPLNGRNVLDLAKLEPGVTHAVRGTSNRVFLPTLGGGLQTIPRIGYTRVTIDGANIGLSGAPGTGLQVSQEAVREFQASTVNFDLANSLTTVGAINAVTRAGGNRYEASAFMMYRDHAFAAYPGLRRDPNNPNPFFRRRQTGATAGGPIRKDRAFIFASYERQDQNGVVSVQPNAPDFAPLGGIFPTTYVGHLFTGRVDVVLNGDHRVFGRYTHDGNRAFAPVGTPSPLPSGWSDLDNRARQGLLSLTSAASNTVVNELRVSYYSVTLGDRPVDAAQCGACFGAGRPRIVIPDAGVTFGSARISLVRADRYQLTDTLTWQKGRHRLRFSFDWEHSPGTETFMDAEPVVMTLWSPRQVRERAPTLPLPDSFHTTEDVLRLPLITFQTGVGPGTVPQHDFRQKRVLDLIRMHVADTWHASPRLTLSGGVAWSYEPNALNHDLSKPPLLIPILGADNLNPPRVQRTNVTPALGFAWTATADGSTVVRGGVGRYVDPAASANSINLSNERRALLPVGTTRIVRSGANIVGDGLRLEFLREPTAFTGADLLRMLEMIRADLLESVNPANRDFTVRTIDVTKQGSNLSDPAYRVPSAIHINLGVQRELVGGFVLSADAVRRRFVHTFINGIDYNRWNSISGPILPPCSAEQRNDPGAVCSNGSIFFDTTIGRARYQGLLARLEKRYSRGYQLLASYALGSFVGTNGTGTGTAEGSAGRVFGFNNDDWFENYGPLPTDLRHTLNVSGFVDLPWRFQLAASVSAYSRPPFSAYVADVDFTGDGTVNDLLPGTTVNAFGRGLEKDDLIRLVGDYNRQYAGRRFGAANTLAGELALPEGFSLGDNFFTTDVRFSRSFRVGRRATLTATVDMFNLFNTANLVGYSGNLSNRDIFGQPTGRFTQVFGSGGPRSIELSTRFTF